jgi:hypothetical protein
MIRKPVPIQELVIPQYLREVLISKKRRTKYYNSFSDLPKNWKRDNFYEKKGKVFRKKDNKPVIKNRKTAGEAKYETLAGNKFWSGYGHPTVRAKLARELKESYLKHLHQLSPFDPRDYPLIVEWEVYRPINERFDLSNMWFYYKMLEDTLVDEGIIPDDSVFYISALKGPRIVPVETWEERKIVVRFYRETRGHIRMHNAWRAILDALIPGRKAA